jgi:hypothetical protein
MTVSQQDLFKQFPSRRIKSYDGMVVTSDVWEEAHDYHRRQQRYHNLLNHEPGILIGLEVIASDPPDSAVYIQPGIALDAVGQVIIVPEALSFDLGAAQGPLYLVLSYDESQPKAEDSATPAEDATDIRLFVRVQYGLEVVGTPPDPTASYVELARVQRQGADASITNATDLVHPGLNQIDLRFRRQTGIATQPAIKVAVCYAGKATDKAAKRHGHGAQVLARVLRHGHQPVWVDDDVALATDAELSSYALVYLVAQGEFQLTADEMNVLYVYLRSGGTLLLEPCHKVTATGKAEAVLLEMLSSFGTTITDLPSDHALLREPNFFAAPPVGFETEGAPSIKVGEGVILSACDYGCLWQGERRDQAASREEIRAAHEWGSNILAYAVARRAQFNETR